MVSHKNIYKDDNEEIWAISYFKSQIFYSLFALN